MPPKRRTPVRSSVSTRPKRAKRIRPSELQEVVPGANQETGGIGNSQPAPSVAQAPPFDVQALTTNITTSVTQPIQPAPGDKLPLFSQDAVSQSTGPDTDLVEEEICAIIEDNTSAGNGGVSSHAADNSHSMQIFTSISVSLTARVSAKPKSKRICRFWSCFFPPLKIRVNIHYRWRRL